MSKGNTTKNGIKKLIRDNRMVCGRNFHIEMRLTLKLIENHWIARKMGDREKETQKKFLN